MHGRHNILSNIHTVTYIFTESLIGRTVGDCTHLIENFLW